MFGNPETTTGGNALKFYASVRADIRHIGQIKEGEEIIGNRTKVKIVKNKIAPPFRVARIDIMYNEGISKTGDVLDLAVRHGVVGKAGAWFDYNDAKIGQDWQDKKYLKENPKVLAEIEKKVTTRLRRREQLVRLLMVNYGNNFIAVRDPDRINVNIDGKYRFSLDISQVTERRQGWEGS